MNKQNEQQPIIHYVCKECQDKGLINPPCVHFKGDNEKKMKWIDCEGVGDNNGFYEMEVPVQDNKGTWEGNIDKVLPQMITDLVWVVTDGGRRIEPREFLTYQEEPVREYDDIKSFIANERKAAQEELATEIIQRLKGGIGKSLEKLGETIREYQSISK